MHVFGMLKWTATILLVSICECRGLPAEPTSCIYSFQVSGSQVQAGCPGNGQSSEVLRLAESLDELKGAFEVLQVIMRARSLLRHIATVNFRHGIGETGVGWDKFWLGQCPSVLNESP